LWLLVLAAVVAWIAYLNSVRVPCEVIGALVGHKLESFSVFHGRSILQKISLKFEFAYLDRLLMLLVVKRH
jgi:hypothetical protein